MEWVKLVSRPLTEEEKNRRLPIRFYVGLYNPRNR